jgi:hypothetical protein
MADDTGLTSAADYQRFVHDQVTSTLAGVDAGPPVAGFRLFLAGAAPLSWLRSMLATLLGGVRLLLERPLVRNRERLGRGHRERS